MPVEFRFNPAQGEGLSTHPANPPQKKALADKSALLVVTTLIRSGNEAIREPNCLPKSSLPDAAFAVLMATGPCYFWLPGDRLCHHTSWDQFLDR
jgi:hypothetical protein